MGSMIGFTARSLANKGLNGNGPILYFGVASSSETPVESWALKFHQKGRALNRKAQDQRIFKELIRSLERDKISATSPESARARDLASSFWEHPMWSVRSKLKEAERLVVNLREFDCFTFVENVVALAWLLKSREKSFEGFRRLLRKIRYRNGRLQGYSSRLHYFSDWIHDNQKKGIVRDVTADNRGQTFQEDPQPS